MCFWSLQNRSGQYNWNIPYYLKKIRNPNFLDPALSKLPFFSTDVMNPGRLGGKGPREKTSQGWERAATISASAFPKQRLVTHGRTFSLYVHYRQGKGHKGCLQLLRGEVLMLKAQKELGRDSCPKGRRLSRMLLGTETQASDGAWEQRKPTAGMGPARLPSSASYPAMAVQPHAFLFIYLANFFKEGGKKPPSTQASFSATCGNLPHTLDSWGKKIPPEFLQCPTFTLDKPRCPRIGHRFKGSLSLPTALRKPTSFSFGKKSTHPTRFCIYNSICVCDRRQAPTS